VIGGDYGRRRRSCPGGQSVERAYGLRRLQSLRPGIEFGFDLRDGVRRFFTVPTQGRSRDAQSLGQARRTEVAIRKLDQFQGRSIFSRLPRGEPRDANAPFAISF